MSSNPNLFKRYTFSPFQIKGGDEEWKAALETKRGPSLKNMVSIKTGEKRIRAEGRNEEFDTENDFKDKKSKKMKKKKIHRD